MAKNENESKENPKIVQTAGRAALGLGCALCAHT